MAPETHFVSTSALLPSTPTEAVSLPRGCTFSESDWSALAPFWYPIAFSHEVKDKPYAARLLDEHAEAHFPADRSSIAYRKALAALGLGRNFTA